MNTNKELENTIAWGCTRITYEIMTDSKGQQWKVPTHIDGDPVEYLRKHDSNDHIGTYETQTHQTPKT